MIVEPEQRVADFIKAGADIVSVHAEVAATIHLHRTINLVSSPCIHTLPLLGDSPINSFPKMKERRGGDIILLPY